MHSNAASGRTTTIKDKSRMAIVESIVKAYSLVSQGISFDFRGGGK